jgi:hypothetical protein
VICGIAGVCGNVMQMIVHADGDARVPLINRFVTNMDGVRDQQKFGGAGVSSDVPTLTLMLSLI